MDFTEEELELIEISLRSLLDYRGGADSDIEQLIEKVAKRNVTDSIGKKRIINLLTESEIQEVQNLKKGIMRSSTNAEIRYHRHKIDEIIKKAKDRYFDL